MKNLSGIPGRALLLALQELGRCRNSYLWMVGVSLLAGLGAVFFATQAFAADRLADNPFVFALDFIFIVSLLSLPRMGAWATRGESVTSLPKEHLPFLRLLPLDARELVAGRILTLLVSVAIPSAALLSLPYIFSEPFRAQFVGFEYLLFTTFWVGFTMVWESISLFTELGMSNWPGFLTYLAIIFVTSALVGYFSGSGIGAIPQVIEALREHGPLLGLPILLFGILALTFSGWCTTRRLEKRELGR